MPDLIQIVAERALKDDAFREAVQNHHTFRSLMEHPAWLLLKEKLDRTEEAYMADLARQMMSGELLDQRKIDRSVGFVEGVRSVLSLPERIEEDFERVLQRAWDLAVDDAEQEAT